jgi:hypothetical protein
MSWKTAQILRRGTAFTVPRAIEALEKILINHELKNSPDTQERYSFHSSQGNRAHTVHYTPYSLYSGDLLLAITNQVYSSQVTKLEGRKQFEHLGPGSVVHSFRQPSLIPCLVIQLLEPCVQRNLPRKQIF